jgi:hypothetical protein
MATTGIQQSQGRCALDLVRGTDRKEDVEFRLLHVRFSVKRAINMGVSGIAEEESTYYPASAPLQLLHRAATKRLKVSPLRSLPQQQPNIFLNSPAITTSSVNSTSLCGSPLSFEVLPPYKSPRNSANTNSRAEKSNSSSTVYPTWPEQLIVTPINDLLPHRPKSPFQRQLTSQTAPTRVATLEG